MPGTICHARTTLCRLPMPVADRKAGAQLSPELLMALWLRLHYYSEPPESQGSDRALVTGPHASCSPLGQGWWRPPQ